MKFGKKEIFEKCDRCVPRATYTRESTGYRFARVYDTRVSDARASRISEGNIRGEIESLAVREETFPANIRGGACEGRVSDPRARKSRPGSECGSLVTKRAHLAHVSSRVFFLPVERVAVYVPLRDNRCAVTVTYETVRLFVEIARILDPGRKFRNRGGRLERSSLDAYTFRGKSCRKVVPRTLRTTKTCRGVNLVRARLEGRRRGKPRFLEAGRSRSQVRIVLSPRLLKLQFYGALKAV